MSNRVYVIEASDDRTKWLIKLLGEDGRIIALSGAALSQDDEAVYVLPPNVVVASENVGHFKAGSKVFCGRADDAAKELGKRKNLEIFEFLEYGQFVCKNAIITAKCLFIYVLKWEKTLHYESEILLAGFGRVGRAVADILAPFYGKIDVLTREPEKTLFYGRPVLKSECEYEKYDLIISTVPEHIFGEEELTRLKPTAHIMELASKPYSFDTKTADGLRVSYEILPALPAKLLPRQAAAIMKEFVDKKIAD